MIKAEYFIPDSEYYFIELSPGREETCILKSDIPSFMIKFGRYCATEALKAAHRNMQLPDEDLEFTLNSFDLNNIQ